MPDFFASLVVFGVILVIFLSTWNSVLDNQVGYAQEEKIDLRATHTTAFLVTTPGFPDNWEEEGVDPEIPGFASPSNILQIEKLDAFQDIEYAEQRRLLQTRNFYLDITDIEGNEIASFGRSYENATDVYPYRRTVQVNQSGNLEQAEMRYIVWR